MWYDIFVLAILGYFTIRGASKGFVWQIAGIAGIVVCFAFADAITAAIAPHVHLTNDPSLNNWIILFGAYIALTFVSFGVARMLTEMIEKAKLKEFNNHLGAVFGLLKGVIICLVVTYGVVTVSETAAEKLRESKSGYVAAHIMNRLHVFMPEKLHDRLEDYIHKLDHPDFNLPDPHAGHDHGGTLLGQPGQIQNGNPDNPFPQNGNGLFPPSQPGTTTPGAPTAGMDFWGQMRSVLDVESQRIVQNAIQSRATSGEQTQLENDLTKIIQSTPREQLPSLRQQIAQYGANRIDQFIASKLGTTPNGTIPNGQETTSPFNPTTPSQPTQPTNNTGGNFFPNWPGTNPSNPNGNPVAVSAVDQAINQITSLYPEAARGAISTNLKNAVAGLPEPLSVGVINDLRVDILGGAIDPDPTTDRNTSIEHRVINQLSMTRTNFANLNAQWQSRLRAASAQSQGTNGRL